MTEYTNSKHRKPGISKTGVPQFSYHYFVSFKHDVPDGIGFTNMELTMARPIRDLDLVRQIETRLRRDGYVNPLVLGFA